MGYHTGIIGKWHLGLESPNTPNERGFDHFHGFLGDMMDSYTTHLRHGNNYMRLNAEVVDPKGHATDIFTDWAGDYLRERAKSKDKPFFLYLAYNAPHFPIEPPAEWLAKVKARAPQLDEKRATNVAFVEHLDDRIERVLAVLTETGLDENTVVVFSADNGGSVPHAQNNDPWRWTACRTRATWAASCAVQRPLGCGRCWRSRARRHCGRPRCCGRAWVRTLR